MHASLYAVVGETLLLAGIASGIGTAYLYLRKLRRYMTDAAVSSISLLMVAGVMVAGRSIVRLSTLADPARSVVIAIFSGVFFLVVLAAAELTRRAAFEEFRGRDSLHRALNEKVDS